jgi:hypothetical protein
MPWKKLRAMKRNAGNEKFLHILLMCAGPEDAVAGRTSPESGTALQNIRRKPADNFFPGNS